ncbi:MAG: phosphoglucosamine mutase [Rickettsiales bacterium]|jgi:phosphoglucosamine mutase|nr:phosphoglucosamine mutase [Rickettsiales bacterium]
MVKKYFGTDGIRGKVNIFPITADFAVKLGLVLARVLDKNSKSKVRVIIGNDTRQSCYALESALAAGLAAGGVREVVLVGSIPTPGISMLTRSMRCDLGVMISASHNPYYDNGIKLFDSNGVKFPDSVEEEIEAMISDDSINNSLVNGEMGRILRSSDFTYQQRYIEYVKSSFPKNLSLQGIKVVVDCANGAGYEIAPTIFWELGANVVKIGCEPNGTNINDKCGSTRPEALQKRVMEEGADLGVALDGDADRLIIVDEEGNVVDGDKIIAFLAKKMSNDSLLKNNVVVVTQMSNLGLELYLRSLGINVVRTNVGDRYVAEEMRRGGYNFGGEQSGHIIIGDFATTGDGICSALQVMACLQYARKNDGGVKLSAITNLYKTIPQKLKNVAFDPAGQNPLETEEFKNFVVGYERELKDIGRILVRKSGTEPVLRVMVECSEEKKLDEILNNICEKLCGKK